MSVTEIMLILVFMALALSALARSEWTELEADLQDQAQEQSDQIVELEAQIAELDHRNSMIEEEILRLHWQREASRQLLAELRSQAQRERGNGIALGNRIAALEGSSARLTLERDACRRAASESETLAQSDRRAGTDRVQTLGAQLGAANIRNAGLERAIAECQARAATIPTALPEPKHPDSKATGRQQAGGMAPGLPPCFIIKDHLLEFMLQPDGTIVGTATWRPSEDGVASALPGIADLRSGKRLPHEQFRAAAARLNAWANAQSQPCKFKVRVKRHPSTNVDVYDEQLNLIEDFFRYARARR